jgi:hypothetical protein
MESFSLDRLIVRTAPVPRRREMWEKCGIETHQWSRRLPTTPHRNVRPSCQDGCVSSIQYQIDHAQQQTRFGRKQPVEAPHPVRTGPERITTPKTTRHQIFRARIEVHFVYRFAGAARPGATSARRDGVARDHAIPQVDGEHHCVLPIRSCTPSRSALAVDRAKALAASTCVAFSARRW